MFACENMIQNMIVNEMRKHIEDDDDEEDDEIADASRAIVFAPLQIMYESDSDEDS